MYLVILSNHKHGKNLVWHHREDRAFHPKEKREKRREKTKKKEKKRKEKREEKRREEKRREEEEKRREEKRRRREGREEKRREEKRREEKRREEKRREEKRREEKREKRRKAKQSKAKQSKQTKNKRGEKESEGQCGDVLNEVEGVSPLLDPNIFWLSPSNNLPQQFPGRIASNSAQWSNLKKNICIFKIPPVYIAIALIHAFCQHKTLNPLHIHTNKT